MLKVIRHKPVKIQVRQPLNSLKYHNYIKKLQEERYNA